MTALADVISVEGRFARSANLERDLARPEPLDGYIVTARALDVVDRIATAAVAGAAGGAWSLTGPYGSGKSSLALLLDAALGDSAPIREVALKLIGDASPATIDLVRRAHRRHGTENHGFHRGLVTADREPLNRTVLRALHGAVLRSYGKIPNPGEFRAAEMLRGALEDAATDDPRRTGPSPSALVETARCLAQDAPLLLIIDEFGKNLEAIRDGGDADPYLLQRLAEAGQGSGLPIFILTLQHLSFEDYLTGVEGPQRREWAKVQGRFEDIAFVESAGQIRALIGTAFNVGAPGLRDRIDRWAQSHAKTMRNLGIADLADPRVVASCYPLHPLVALVLPELCSRYGQHERTLFSFLTDPHSASALSFLADTSLPARGPLPSLGLEAVYDYFVATGALSVTSARQSGRWAEIASRLRDSHGLTAPQARMAKAIALLNLVSTTGTVRASRQILTLTGRRTDDALAALESAGVATYRDFADEYRIWHGSDVDIRLLLDAARQRIQRQPLIEILPSIDHPSPVVAAGHSARHNVLRVFDRRYADGSEHIEPLDAFSPYDGEVLLVVGSDGREPSMTRSGAGIKPVVAAIPADLSVLGAATREVAAVMAALDDPAVTDDWVARRELGERLAQTRVAFEHALATTFGADACRWVLLGADGEEELHGNRGSAPLSAAADRAYSSTPTVRNEMLNRTELTSQGSKARRLLLEAMIERGTEPDLGLEGYGPEMAMYRAFLGYTGLHGADKRNSVMSFRRPKDESLKPAWEILESEFQRAKARRLNLNDLYAALLSPPIGMKAAAIPVFLTAGLLAFSDEVAIYEHGTFMSLLAADVSQRMVRNPGHFDIKHFANTTGARREVVDALATRLGVRPGFHKHRVANVLAIVGHIVSRLHRLENYTLRTRNLMPRTLRAREVLTAAVEPDELLFVSLPEALGFDPVPVHTASYSDADAYADRVGVTLDELAGCSEQLLAGLLELLLETSAETTRLAVMGQAHALEGKVLDPEARAFVLALANHNVDADTDWIKTIATVVAKKAPAEWTDHDEQRFRSELPQQVATFHRLVALHAEHRAGGGGPFDPLRVTVTRPAGSERAILVGIDHSQRSSVEEALDSAVRKLTEVMGSPRRAHHVLLALLGERLLPEHTSSGDETNLDVIAERTHHG